MCKSARERILNYDQMQRELFYMQRSVLDLGYDTPSEIFVYTTHIECTVIESFSYSGCTKIKMMNPERIRSVCKSVLSMCSLQCCGVGLLSRPHSLLYEQDLELPSVPKAFLESIFNLIDKLCHLRLFD